MGGLCWFRFLFLSLWLYCATPFWPAWFLLKRWLTVEWKFPCLHFHPNFGEVDLCGRHVVRTSSAHPLYAIRVSHGGWVGPPVVVGHAVGMLIYGTLPCPVGCQALPPAEATGCWWKGPHPGTAGCQACGALGFMLSHWARQDPGELAAGLGWSRAGPVGPSEAWGLCQRTGVRCGLGTPGCGTRAPSAGSGLGWYQGFCQPARGWGQVPIQPEGSRD